jgi:hypothetical protein
LIDEAKQTDHQTNSDRIATIALYRRYETESHSALERKFMLGTVLVVLLVLMLVGALPTWPHSRTWGYGPTGGLGVVLAILVVLLLLGRL